MSLFASLDLGTNTFRLLIAKIINSDTIVPILVRRAITRLGEGLQKNASIQPQATKRSLKVLEDFSKIIDYYKVEKVFAVTTSAAREAKNGQDFIDQIHKRTGIQARILTGSEEAELTVKGVFSVVDRTQSRNLVFDIGGGSTEFILTEGISPIKTTSIRLGVIHLLENLITSDPPASNELDYLSKYINIILQQHDLIQYIPNNKSTNTYSVQPLLIGTAGTVTTLAAIDQKIEEYDPQKINNHILTREAVENIYKQLCSLSIAERCTIPGLEKGREAVIVPGAAIVIEIMDHFKFNQLIVSDAGLLEGILLDEQTSY
ncbi:MAG: Ppx/GppA family phosphatase [Deltaproteobacteria bacterium]|nr:Ppx/GppA family phosphatase [Deltaproteobacteria bacterium]